MIVFLDKGNGVSFKCGLPRFGSNSAHGLVRNTFIPSLILVKFILIHSIFVTELKEHVIEELVKVYICGVFVSFLLIGSGLVRRL